MELAELTVRGFTEEIASASPAPGGGSAGRRGRRGTDRDGQRSDARQEKI
jgi:hypothetical protein